MPDAPASSPILIVGAGPTGLVLALSLARRGVAFRIIDAEDGPGEHSRAMGVQARTLEFYRQYGFADEVVRSGVIADQAHFRRRGPDGQEHEAATLRLRDAGQGVSPYPYLLAFPQDDHERLLIGKLEALRVHVEWKTKLIHFAEAADGIAVTLDKDGVSEPAHVQWLVGCDGARSIVRQILGVGFTGGTYEQLFYVADVAIDGGFERDLYANLGENGLAIMMPVRSSGMQRLIGLIPRALAGRKDLKFDDVRSDVEPLIGVKVTQVNWFSTYRVHHRVAARFRVGRTFIAGDAGHIHSPVGGQGMNTGIGDAINLGWKLADVVRGRASAVILDTYEAERRPLAERLVATTDRAFDSIIAAGFKGRFIRNWLAPVVIGMATHFASIRRRAFRAVSQTAISYPDSLLSEGRAGISGGERLPWIEGRNEDEDNFTPLQSLDWQVHVYGEPEAGLAETCGRLGLALHVRPWSAATRDGGLRRNATYLIRPDGYVGLASASGSARRLESYVDRLGLRSVS